MVFVCFVVHGFFFPAWSGNYTYRCSKHLGKLDWSLRTWLLVLISPRAMSGQVCEAFCFLSLFLPLFDIVGVLASQSWISKEISCSENILRVICQGAKPACWVQDFAEPCSSHMLDGFSFGGFLWQFFCDQFAAVGVLQERFHLIGAVCMQLALSRIHMSKQSVSLARLYHPLMKIIWSLVLVLEMVGYHPDWQILFE